MFNLRMKEEVVTEEREIRIIEAKSEAERQAIYQFRYEVLVNEMGRDIADHASEWKRISDEVDFWSHLFYIESQGQIVGTARLTVGGANEFPQEYYNIFQLGRFEQFCSQSNYLLGSKFMVAPQYRNSSAFFRLMRKGCEVARENNVQFTFGGCNPYLLPTYEKFGYRIFASGFQDKGYGFIVPIICLTEDIEHYYAVHSPLLRVARKVTNSPVAKNWFVTNFPEVVKQRVGILTSKSERWEYIAAVVGDPLVCISILSDFYEEEAKCLLHAGSLIACRNGQQFIRRGDVCNELYILLRGEMAVYGLGKRIQLAKPGDAVGAMGLFGQTHHYVNVTAIADCELLAISRFSFEKLQKSMPEIMAKLLTGENVWEG